MDPERPGIFKPFGGLRVRIDREQAESRALDQDDRAFSWASARHAVR